MSKLWLDPDLPLTTVPLEWEVDLQEALSYKYSARGVWLIALESGRWAVFDTGRSLVQLSETLPTEQELRAMSISAERIETTRIKANIAGTDKSAEDLGL